MSRNNNYIVTDLLKARTVQPEQHPLLANESEQHSFLGNGREINNGTTSAARLQILDKLQLNSNRNGVFYGVRAEML
jgi:hypothetical protein